MIVPETPLKIKQLGRILIGGGLFVLFFGLVFLLGRVSVLTAQADSAPLEIVYPPLVSTTVPQYKEQGTSGEPESWAFAASQTGKSYYPKGCKGLDRIKQENRIYFTTESEAINAGLTRSTSCH